MVNVDKWLPTVNLKHFASQLLAIIPGLRKIENRKSKAGRVHKIKFLQANLSVCEGFNGMR